MKFKIILVRPLLPEIGAEKIFIIKGERFLLVHFTLDYKKMRVLKRIKNALEYFKNSSALT